MKILVAHNSYQQAGGEDIAVNAEIELLRTYGNDVIEYRKNNHEIASQSRLSTALSTLWSTQSFNEMSALCDQFQPDLIHAHNTFPLISPSLFWLASDKRIPIIQTLHNFRLLCPQAMLLRDGKVCEDCIGKSPWRAMTRRCYHGSLLQSTVVASMLATHRTIRTFQDRVTSYIAMNQFCREKFICGGLPADRIHIKPNFVKARRVPDWENRHAALFVGRLSEEKGIALLIQAATQVLSENATPSLPIQVVGDGPLASEVKRAFHDHYLGVKSSDDIFMLLRSALFLIAPSTCYETFGLAAAEAFSCGVPVIASRHGGLAELVADGVTGLLFTPGDADDLAKKIAWANAHPARMLEMGRAAYDEYLNKYTPERNYEILMEIYRNALQDNGEQHEN